MKSCLQCGNTFTEARPLSKPHKFCSHACYAKSKVGKPAPNKGKKGIGLGVKRPGVTLAKTGEKNNNWKGDEVGYRSLHLWVERKMGRPCNCSSCSKYGTGTDMQWANKSGEYKRIITDWIRLCRKCHGAYDKNRRLAAKEMAYSHI